MPLAYAQESQWNWVSRDTLTAEQQGQLNKYCQGSYVNSWQATNETNTTLVADLIYRDKNGVTYLDGNAQILQPKATLSADSIEGVPNGYYQAKGNVTLQSADQFISSSNSYISDNNISGNNSNATVFENAHFLNYESNARIEAASLTNDQQGVVFIEEGFFTTCEPNQESWKLYGHSITLNPNTGFGTAKHVHIRIAGWPVFYFPWLRFPIDEQRHTGFLFPSASYSNDDGFSLSAPFYWNIASNYDATITPHYIQNKGEGIDLEFRHLSPYGETVFEQSSFEDSTEGLQILRKLSSTQQFNDVFSAGLTYEENPTEDLYPEANSTSIGEKDNYEQSLYIQLDKGNFLNKATYLTYQTPDDSEDKPFEWKPRLESSYQLASNYLDYKIEAQYTDFYDPDEDDFDGQRLAINQDTSLNYDPVWGSFSAGILSRYRDYEVYDYTSNSTSTTTLAHNSYYLDTSLSFERRLMKEDGMWRQTLEPKLSYLNAPYSNQSSIEDFDASDPTLTYARLFNHSRFSGNDRIGDTEQISLGLEASLYDNDNSERWSFQAGQAFYLKDRYVDIDGDTSSSSAVDDSSHSDVLTSASYYGDYFSVTNSLNYSLDDNEINLVEFVAKLEPLEDVKFNLSYLYSLNNSDSDDDANQASIATIFPLNQNWSMYSQYTYDFLDNNATKQVTGLGYENCCIKVSLSYQDWLDDDDERDRGVFLQFILRSLSKSGSANSETSIADTYWNEGQIGY
ncbi:LPS assembly protein LptD [Marinomonas sp. C2222]|uniref:LPS-assembly protein LptD n=1 Tax=Marinomonas sargassi TaxID=2984494 RepID=A0ABT2YNQ5_9GAMM|nr:LPS assembly protein LptD [Marinomonas sargassi]MCV2401528.1 LPS assembly protein LptD [Marinomonas sargassi]